MNQTSTKKYEPEFTQLPFKFIDKNMNLRKLIRTKGPCYLSYYIAIQDNMAGHPEESFTLSHSELIDAIRETLFLFSVEDDEIIGWINELLSADVIEKRYLMNPENAQEVERYCIASVVDALEEAKTAWITKCVNPSKLPKEDKARIATLREKVRETDKAIRELARRRRGLEARLDIELDKKPIDENEVKIIRAEMDACRRKNAELYREKMVNESAINKIKSTKGELIDEE